MQSDFISEASTEKNVLNPQYVELEKDFFTKLKRQGKSPNTLKNYKTDLDCFKTFMDNSRPVVRLAEMGPAQIKHYGEYLEKKYNSDNSRRRRVQALRLFFDFLIEVGIFNENPVRQIPTSPKFLDIPRPAPLVEIKTLWQFLLEEAQKPGDALSTLLAKRNLIMVMMIFGSGLKVSDLEELTRDHVSIDGNKARVLIEHGKRDPYTIPLPDIFVDIYLDYIESLDRHLSDTRHQFNKLLFSANAYSILGGGLSARGIEVIFEEWRKKLMLTLTPKSLRQACIFFWLQQKESESLIKEWLGLAPSYSLKLYKDHMMDSIYDQSFLEYSFYQALRAHSLPRV